MEKIHCKHILSMFHFQYISIGLILPDIDGARVDLIKRWTKVNNYKKDRIQFYREKMQSVRASHDDFFQLYFSVYLTRSLDRNSWCGFWVLLARFRFTFFVRQTTDICKITGPVSLIWSLSDFFCSLKMSKASIFWHIDWCQDWWVYYDANHAISLPPGCVLPPTTTGPALERRLSHVDVWQTTYAPSSLSHQYPYSIC